MLTVILIGAGLLVYGGCSFVAGVLVYRKRAAKLEAEFEMAKSRAEDLARELSASMKQAKEVVR